jgi:hypothetical protein
MPDVPVNAIRHIEFSGNSDTKQVALTITDASGETRAYAINPATLRAFLAPFLGLAATWTGDPDFSHETLAGTQNAIPAKQILFARGRDDSEAAIRVFLGKDLDISFLIPLEPLVRALQSFGQNHQIVRKPTGPLN